MRHSNLLTKERAVFLIIDIQERLAAAMPNREQIVNNAAKLIKGCRILQVPIFYTEQYPKGLGPTEPSLLALLQDVASFEKITFSACANDAFISTLKKQQRDQIILCGMEAHVCVLQTAMDLLQLGYQSYVVADAVCSRHAFDWQIALKRLAKHGVTITTTEAVLFEMTGAAGSSIFKEMAKLIK